MAAADVPLIVREEAPGLEPPFVGLPASAPFTGLNPRQQAAVCCIDAPLLIVAGPGTGKTRTLTHRIAYLVGAAVPTRSILAITFTNKAAQEMAERLVALLGEERTRQLTIQTFHAFCAALLRTYGDVLGLTPDFTIATDEDRLTGLRQLRPAWSEKLLNEALTALGTAKDQLRTPEDVEGQVGPDGQESLAELYRLFDRELRANALLDFADLILLSVRLLSQHPTVAAELRRRYRWISVDEYQDINLAQYQLLRLLTGGEGAPPPTSVPLATPTRPSMAFAGRTGVIFCAFKPIIPAPRCCNWSRITVPAR